MQTNNNTSSTIKESPKKSYNNDTGNQKSVTAKPVRLVNLDLLRIYLATSVVYGHCTQTQPWFFPIPPVQCFLCLSGFLIPSSFQQSRSWSHFAWKRICRVLPAMLTCFLMIFAMFGHEALIPTFLCYITAGILFMNLSSDGAMWSLIVEEIIYSQHALFQHKKLWRIEYAFIGFVLCLIAIATVHGANAKIPAACAGFFIANMAWFKREKLLSINWSVYAVLLALQFMFRPAFGICTQPGICITTVLLTYTLPQFKLKIPDLSYGVYLYHSLFILWFERQGLKGSQLLEPVMIATVLTSVISWYLIEKPALRIKDLTLEQLRDSRIYLFLSRVRGLHPDTVSDGGFEVSLKLSETESVRA